MTNARQYQISISRTRKDEKGSHYDYFTFVVSDLRSVRDILDFFDSMCDDYLVSLTVSGGQW